MINVLVTGSNGQLGSCIKELASNYNEINFICTDYQELDICNFYNVNTFFESQNNIHYCINCAAYTAVDKAETDIEKANDINVLGAKNLALACVKNDVVLVHISTDFVFDGNSSLPYLETDKPNPISVYGETKLKGELEIEEILSHYFIIRTSWLYSEFCGNFMKTMLRLGETHSEISVVCDQVGTPTYAKDLAEVVLNIINSKNQEFGLYHYSNEGVASWYDFAHAIFDETNEEIKLLPIKTEAYPTPAKRPKFSIIDKSKIKEELNIQISHWRDSLKECLKNLQTLK